MLPFRELLKPGSTFHWTPELNTLFEESKSVIVSEIERGIQIFDKSKPTWLATDWSKAHGSKPYSSRPSHTPITTSTPPGKGRQMPAASLNAFISMAIGILAWKY
jgi:hypothetical protein